MACELADLGIQTTAISDSAIYAMMARVNKASGPTDVLFEWKAGARMLIIKRQQCKSHVSYKQLTFGPRRWSCLLTHFWPMEE